MILKGRREMSKAHIRAAARIFPLVRRCFCSCGVMPSAMIQGNTAPTLSLPASTRERGSEGLTPPMIPVVLPSVVLPSPHTSPHPLQSPRCLHPTPKSPSPSSAVAAWADSTRAVCSQMDRVALIGVHDISPQAAQATADQFNTKYFADLDELLSQAAAVMIAVPTAFHLPIALKALDSARSPV